MFIKTILSLADNNKNNHRLRVTAQAVIIKIICSAYVNPSKLYCLLLIVRLRVIPECLR